MRGGLRRLVHPGTLAHDIDVEGTRAERQRIHQAIRRRQAQLDQLEATPPVPSPSDISQEPEHSTHPDYEQDIRT